MRIELQRVAKRYRFDWILRNVNLQLRSGDAYAITGPNGSGKSTLLRILAGHLSPSRGKVQFFDGQDRSLDPNLVYQRLAYAAPYVELIEEFTLCEAIRFHMRFKPFQAGLSEENVLKLLNFRSAARNKPVRNFSSGMKQRLKLVLAVCTQTDLLLLDEPTTNLDRQGVEWYLDLIGRYRQDRLLVVASNVEEDYQFCGEQIEVTEFKGSGKG